MLVLVGGAPGAGKSTLARRLGEALWLPVLSRDAIKVGLAEPRGIDDPVRGRELAERTFALIYGTIGHFLDAGCSLIAEHGFWRGRSESELAPLIKRARAALVHCHLPREEHIRRCEARLSRRERHGSHPDAEFIAQMRSGTFDWGRYEPPSLAIPIVDVDTADGYIPDLATLVAHIRSAARRGGTG
jgi:predicted kinase